MNFRFFIALSLSISGMSSTVYAEQATKENNEQPSAKANTAITIDELTLEELLFLCVEFHDDLSTDFHAYSRGDYHEIGGCAKYYILRNNLEHNSFNPGPYIPRYTIDFIAYDIVHTALQQRGMHIGTPDNIVQWLASQYAQSNVRDNGKMLWQLTYVPANEYIKLYLNEHNERVALFQDIDQLRSLLESLSTHEMVLVMYNIYRTYKQDFDQRSSNLQGHCTYHELYAKTKESLDTQGTVEQKTLFSYFYTPDRIQTPHSFQPLYQDNFMVYSPDKETAEHYAKDHLEQKDSEEA